MRQFHIYKIEKKWQSDSYHALAEGFSWYGLLFSIVWLCITCIKRDKFFEFIFLLIFVFAVISFSLGGLLVIDGVIFDKSLGFGNFIIKNPILGVAVGFLLSHFFLGFKGNAIIRWAYQNDEYLGIITASTENGAITLFKQNQKVNV